MAKKISPPPDAPFVDRSGYLTAEARRWFENFLQLAETQDDASADPVPKADFDALIDKLQAAGLME